jgi:hypothetical protein
MNDATLKIIEATLKSDPSITPAIRGKFLKLARQGENDESVQSGHAPAFIPANKLPR